MRTLLLATTFSLPTAAFAAGSGDSTPPTPTETTETCTEGQVWDETIQACAAPQDAALSDDGLYGAAREFAYAGQYQNAQRVLAAMSNPQDDRVLTYMGFTTRNLGDVAGGMAYYTAALTQNPDNILARSYLGQSYVEQGQLMLARAQLTEIRARKGRNTWAELSLRQSIENGSGYSY